MDTLGISGRSFGAMTTRVNAYATQRRQGDSPLPEGTDVSVQSSGQALKQSGKKELTAEEQRQVASLQQIDRNVRAHEQAHISAGREVIRSAASFSYMYGPDGKQYAVGGEVGIDTSAEKKPETNITKGMRIQAAALAPMDPSAQDHRVAAIGSQLEAQGRAKLAQQQSEEATTSTDPGRRRVDQAYSTEGNATSINTFA
jgi:hypothetical protein